jgi:ABC-type oligopeptide transport system substrate-binding subunit
LEGKLSPDQLGVKAIDSKTLEVTLTHPVVYFPQFVTGNTILPIREELYVGKGEQYAAEPEHLLTNGAFKLTSWTHGANLKLTKNPDYWDAKNVHLNAINVGYITPDNSTVLNLYKAKQYAEIERTAMGDLPDLTLLTVSEPSSLKLSEYMQGLYKRELGIDIKIDAQNIKQWLVKAFGGDFDVTVISYSPLVGDPADPGALYISSSEANLSNFSHKQYDHLFESFRTSANFEFRVDTLRQMQRIIEDQVPVVPLFENSAVYVQDSRLRGVVRGRLGLSPNFIHSRIR